MSCEAEHGGAPSSKEARVAEEMLKVRQSNYKLHLRFGCQSVFLCQTCSTDTRNGRIPHDPTLQKHLLKGQRPVSVAFFTRQCLQGLKIPRKEALRVRNS